MRLGDIADDGRWLEVPDPLMDYLRGLPLWLRSGPDGAFAVAGPTLCANAALANLDPPSRCGGTAG